MIPPGVGHSKPAMPTSCRTWDMFPWRRRLAIIQTELERVALLEIATHRRHRRSFVYRPGVDHLGGGVPLTVISPSGSAHSGLDLLFGLLEQGRLVARDTQILQPRSTQPPGSVDVSGRTPKIP